MLRFRCSKLIILITAIFLLTTSESSAEIIEKIIAKVNNDIITLSEMREKALALSFEKKIEKDSPVNVKTAKDEQLLHMMIEEILQIQHAKKTGITIPDEYIYSAIDDIKEKNSLSDAMLQNMLEQEKLSFDNYFKKIKEQMMIARVVNFEIKSRILIEEEEIKKYYEERNNEFMLQASVNVRHILLLMKNDAVEEERNKIKKTARAILQKIKNGADFIETTQQYSQGPSAASGGETGFFERGTMAPAFENIAFSLKEGEVSGLIQTKTGFHIIKIIEKRGERPKKLTDVKKEIEGKLFETKIKKKYSEWIKELKENSYIDILLTFNK